MFILDSTSNVELEFLAEGAANVIYKIIPRPTTPSTTADTGFYDYDPAITEIAPPQVDPSLGGKLVRLRKDSAPNCSVLESYEYYEKSIVPIIPREHRVEYVLFKITQPVLSQLNQELRVMESRESRSTKRCGTYLTETEDNGLLVTDMSCSDVSSTGYRCYEFKPKWLAQSPSAPVGAIRCRTCALRNFRRAQRHNARSDTESFSFCPLGLTSDSRVTVGKTLSSIFNWSSGQVEISSIHLASQQRLIDHLHESPLLRRLRELQLLLDPRGVLLTPVSNSEFLTAMTLRDCTVFIKIPTDDTGSPEARIGDLDFKSPSNGKGEYWRSLEESLAEQGWYTAKAKAEFEMDDLCILGHSI